MFSPATLGLTHANNLPTGTLDSPLYFGLSASNGITQSVKSMYFTPDIFFSSRRNLALLLDRGITFSGILTSFEPHYQFIKYSDNDYADTGTNIISQYAGNSANPGWNVELVRSSGKTGSYINLDGFNLVKNFNERFFSELKTYPKRYRTTATDLNAGIWSSGIRCCSWSWYFC